MTVAAPNTPVVAFGQRFHPGDKSPRALPSNRLVGVVIFLGVPRPRQACGVLPQPPVRPLRLVVADNEVHTQHGRVDCDVPHAFIEPG